MEKSDSFQVLDEDSDDEILEVWTPDFQKNQERKRLIKRIVKDCGPDDGKSRPLHVAIIGYHGVGKSAFVNTLAAALGGDIWREYAYSGSHGPITGGITVFTTSFPKCCKSEQYKDVLLPTLVDIAGFDDHQGEGCTELLRIVFYGLLPEGESLAEAEQYYRDKGLEGLRRKYGQNEETLKVDRVIVLSSATTEVPTNLIKSVVDAARPSGVKGSPKRALPIFGVMLKHDKVVSKSEYERRKTDPNAPDLDVIDEETYAKREKSFINGLGLRGAEHRFKRCSNYCSDVDKENRRVDTVIPDLDIPVLSFFTQVISPALKVHNPDENFTDIHKKDGSQVQSSPEVIVAEHAQKQRTPERETRRRKEHSSFVDNFGGNFVSFMMVSIEALVVAFILSFALKPPIDVAKMRGICKSQAGKLGAFSEVCNDLNDGSPQNFMIALIALVIVRVVFTMATVQLFKRKTERN